MLIFFSPALASCQQLTKDTLIQWPTRHHAAFSIYLADMISTSGHYFGQNAENNYGHVKDISMMNIVSLGHGKVKTILKLSFSIMN